MIDTAMKLRCIERELRMRRQVYPRWVAAGSMHQTEAEEEMRVMEAIADDYRRQHEREQPNLFTLIEGSRGEPA